MNPIFLLLLGTVLTLVPSVSWSQPPLKYNSTSGAATEIAGLVNNPGTIEWLPNGGYYYVCPPTVTYGDAGYAIPPRYSGGDGTGLAADTIPLNTGGRTETSYARADARGSARAIVTADASAPCVVYTNYSIFMSTFGRANAQYYKRFTVDSDPKLNQISLDWSLNGSFSSLTSGYGGGDAYLDIYLVTLPPPRPLQGPPLAGGALSLVMHGINSRPTSGNLGFCFQNGCKPLPTATLVNTGGTIDLRQAYYSATGRAMTIGDSFIVMALLRVWTRTCGEPDGCPLLPAFTTDFSMSTMVRSAPLGR